MASLNMVLGMAATRGRVMVTKATKKGGSSSVEEEKGPFDWILGAMQRDHFLETDPILMKVEEKSPTQSKSNTVSVTNKKKFGGLGGLFAKN